MAWESTCERLVGTVRLPHSCWHQPRLASTAVVLALVTAVGWLMGEPAIAQQQLPITSIGRSNYPQVSVTVAIPKALHAATLPDSAFEVEEDREDRKILAVGPVGNDIEVALVLDTSEATRPRLRAIQGAVVEFLLQLPEEARVTIVTNGEGDMRASPLSQNLQNQLASIESLGPQGHLPLHEAISLALDQFSARDNVARTVVLLTTSATTVTDTPPEALIDRLVTRPAALFGIELGAEGHGALSSLELLVGAQVTTTVEDARLVALLDRIAAQVSNSYRLTYRSKGYGPTRLNVVVHYRSLVAQSSAMVFLPVPPEEGPPQQRSASDQAPLPTPTADGPREDRPFPTTTTADPAADRPLRQSAGAASPQNRSTSVAAGALLPFILLLAVASSVWAARS